MHQRWPAGVSFTGIAIFELGRIMDDSPMPLESLDTAYRCPGEPYVIERPIHLARLAAFYPPCRLCHHRRDVETLSSSIQLQWTELERRDSAGPRFGSEGLEAASLNQISADVVHRCAAAVGAVIWLEQTSRREPPAVLVGADGHWTTAELVSVACRALQLSGCSAIEAGAVTSASLAAIASGQRCDAAIWIGNASAEKQVWLRFWGRGGIPWSAPGALEVLRQVHGSEPTRPRRRGGTLRRAGFPEPYLDPIRSLWHALRPLRVVIDTTCQPFVGYLRRLSEQAACQIVPLATSSRPIAGRGGNERNLARLIDKVIEVQAHFGIWVSGDGEVCRLVDERGEPVEHDLLFLAMACFVCRQKPNAKIVLREDVRSKLKDWLSARGCQVVDSPRTRETMFVAMSQSGAELGCGPDGQLWFSGPPPVPDALLALSLLMTLFSQSDRPVSEVVDFCVAGG